MSDSTSDFSTVDVYRCDPAQTTIPEAAEDAVECGASSARYIGQPVTIGAEDTAADVEAKLQAKFDHVKELNDHEGFDYES